VDGTVVDGVGYVNEAQMTGESMPEKKEARGAGPFYRDLDGFEPLFPGWKPRRFSSLVHYDPPPISFGCVYSSPLGTILKEKGGAEASPITHNTHWPFADNPRD
jgi:hypothetical protein